MGKLSFSLFFSCIAIGVRCGDVKKNFVTSNFFLSFFPLVWERELLYFFNGGGVLSFRMLNFSFLFLASSFLPKRRD